MKLQKRLLFFPLKKAVFVAPVVIAAQVLSPEALATADVAITSTASLEVTAPASLPAGFTISFADPPVTTLPDGGNSGTGSVLFAGTSNGSGSGLTTTIDLSNDLQCTSSPAGIYGGIEDAFATFVVQNNSGGPVTLRLSFETSWSTSTTVTNPGGGESAEADLAILFPLVAEWSPSLVNCPDGSIDGSTLVLALSDIDTTGGNAGESGGPSTCTVDFTVPSNNTSSGADLGTTATCSTVAPALTLSVPPTPVPATPLWSLAGLLALLGLAGWRQLRRKGKG